MLNLKSSNQPYTLLELSNILRSHFPTVELPKHLTRTEFPNPYEDRTMEGIGCKQRNQNSVSGNSIAHLSMYLTHTSGGPHVC